MKGLELANNFKLFAYSGVGLREECDMVKKRLLLRSWILVGGYIVKND